MLISLVASLVLIALGQVFPIVIDRADDFVAAVDFDSALLDVMLSYLLFAGAMHVDIGSLAKQKWIIAMLATVGVMLSTFIVGTAMYYLLGAFGLEIRFIDCLLFGALISPTDPVAVLGILKKAGAPKSLETKITGESLFNDGVGVVVFLAILQIAKGGDATVADIGQLFLVEVGGGIAFGFAIGALGFHMLKRLDNYQIEILITLAQLAKSLVLSV